MIWTIGTVHRISPPLPAYSLLFQINTGVKNLKLPPVIKKRGRPKGAEKTVIGLPARKKFKGDQVRKPVSFLRKSPTNKDEGI